MESEWVPGCAEGYADLPGLRLHYLPDASHWVQMDCPDEVNRLMLDFLADGGL